MTPGIKGNSSMNRIKNLGACGGPGQPPCEPRFEKEIKEEKSMRAMDKSNYSKAKSFVKAKPVKEASKPAPVKLQINLPKGYEFATKAQKAMFYEKFSDLSGFKSQEELDAAVQKQLKAVPPKENTKPVEEPVAGPVVGPVKGGESEAVAVKGVAAKIAK